MDDFLKLMIVMIVLVISILLGVLFYITYKEKIRKSDGSKTEKKVNDEQDEKKAKRSIFKFMEFDTVEDNMIVQDNGKRYLMVIECKGVNYDLLSGVEKNSVEQGFINFLNALKFEIQLYVQTRKVNLRQSTMQYRERLKAIEMDMLEEEQKYAVMQRQGDYTKDEILKELKEITKKRNLYEYAKDVIENTEQMSQDSDLTTKSYYIVVPYYTDEITSAGDYNKREIGSMAFSELYTRAQSLVNTLTECDVRGRILTSQELVELLFISYNREQRDTYDFEEYMSQSGFESFYSVTQDVLEKRMAAINEEIERKGNERAIEAYRRTNKRIEAIRKAAEEREKRMQEYIDKYANQLVDSRKGVLGESIVEKTKQELKTMAQEDKEKEERKANRFKNNDEELIKDETINEEKPAKEKRGLTEEEKRIRRAKILRRRKLLKEREARENAKKQNAE